MRASAPAVIELLSATKPKGEAMANATFIPTFDVTAEASRAGRFPGRRTVSVVDNRRLSDGIYRLTFRDSYIAGHA